MAFEKDEIILVNPTGGWNSRIDDHYFYPIGLLYLRNFLLKHGIPSTIIDINRQGLSTDQFQQMITKLKPKIIGFTGSPFERHPLHSFIRGIKKAAPQTLVVVGGPYFTATAKECLQQLAEVDVVVRGEGEKTFLELVRAFEAGVNFNRLQGITFRSDKGEIIETANNSPCNRDECEIDINLIPNDENYAPYVYLKNFEQEKIKAIPILLARGCTMNCTFCFNNNNGRFLSRTIPSIIAEIKAKREKFQCDYFWFVDPTFTLRERFAATLCKELQVQCPGIKWYCETRADCNPELLENMAEAGCISIDVALESGSPKVLKMIQKNLDPQTLVPFTAKCKQLGIRVLVFVMYGLPGETYVEFLETINILKKIKQDIYTISYSQTLVLPGTRLEMQAKEEKKLPGNFSWYDPTFSDIPRWESLMTDREIDQVKRMLFKYQYLLHNSRLSYLGKLPKLLALTYWQRNEKFKAMITRFPMVHRLVRFVSRIVLGKESL